MFPLKKFFNTLLYHVSLFFILIIGVQNSINKTKVNLITTETVNLPISFIVGVSFISGSLTGTLLTINPIIKKH